MEIDCVQRNDTFKLEITLHRDNVRLKLINCLLPDPTHFSLPSTFKVPFQPCQGWQQFNGIAEEKLIERTKTILSLLMIEK
jgi:hypothetical protein